MIVRRRLPRVDVERLDVVERQVQQLVRLVDDLLDVSRITSGKIQLKDSFAEVQGNEAWLLNAHISQYSHGNRENHEPTRRRKLLLHRAEIDKLLGKTREKGLTLIPTKMYLKKGRVKVELAVAKGKKLHDKRETEKKRSWDRERGRLLRAKG